MSLEQPILTEPGPGWHRIMTFGKKVQNGEEFDFTVETLSQVVDNFALVFSERRMGLDAEHQVLYAPENGESAPQLGAYSGLALIEGGKVLRHWDHYPDALPPDPAELLERARAKFPRIESVDGLWAYLREVTPLGMHPEKGLANYHQLSPYFAKNDTSEEGQPIGYCLANVSAVGVAFQNGTVMFSKDLADKLQRKTMAQIVADPELRKAWNDLLQTVKKAEDARRAAMAIGDGDLHVPVPQEKKPSAASADAAPPSQTTPGDASPGSPKAGDPMSIGRGGGTPQDKERIRSGLIEARRKIKDLNDRAFRDGDRWSDADWSRTESELARLDGEVKQLVTEAKQNDWDDIKYAGLARTGPGATSMAWLYDHDTDQRIRMATPAEETASEKAAQTDGGAGVIKVDGRNCYVMTKARMAKMADEISKMDDTAFYAKLGMEPGAPKDQMMAKLAAYMAETEDGPEMRKAMAAKMGECMARMQEEAPPPTAPASMADGEDPDKKKDEDAAMAKVTSIFSKKLDEERQARLALEKRLADQESAQQRARVATFKKSAAGYDVSEGDVDEFLALCKGDTDKAMTYVQKFPRKASGIYTQFTKDGKPISADEVAEGAHETVTPSGIPTNGLALAKQARAYAEKNNCDLRTAYSKIAPAKRSALYG